MQTGAEPCADVSDGMHKRIYIQKETIQTSIIFASISASICPSHNERSRRTRAGFDSLAENYFLAWEPNEAAAPPSSVLGESLSSIRTKQSQMLTSFIGPGACSRGLRQLTLVRKLGDSLVCQRSARPEWMGDFVQLARERSVSHSTPVSPGVRLLRERGEVQRSSRWARLVTTAARSRPTMHACAARLRVQTSF